MKRDAALVLAILLLATALRFYRVGEMSLRADEATNLFLAAQAPAEIVRPLVESDPHLPLYFIALHFWMSVAGQSELAARSLSVFAGVLVVALVYALGRVAFPQRRALALLGAFLAAINPYLIWDAQDVYMYAFLTASVAGSFVTFVRVMPRDVPARVWIGYVILSALSIFLHYVAAFALLAQGVVVLVWIARRKLARQTIARWIVAQICVAALFLPWLILALPLLASFQTDFLGAANLVEMIARGFIALSVGRADSRLMPPMVEPMVGAVLTLGFATIFALGLFARRRPPWDGDADVRLALALFLFAPLAAMFAFSILRFPIFDERYILYLTPAFALLVARGLDALEAARRSVFVAAMLFVVVASAYSLNNYFHVAEFAKSPDWRAFTQTLIAQSQPGDVLIQNYPDPALPYYLQNRVPRVLLPRSASATMAEVSVDLQRLTTKYTRVWFQAAPYAAWDTEALVETWLRRHTFPISVSNLPGLRLALYLPAAVALRQATPIDATFAGQIRLLAFDSGAREQAVYPGATMRVILYWQAITPPSRAATVFVHLYDAYGELWSQQDNMPVSGMYPTNEWVPEITVVDWYPLRIPANAPSGKYSLEVGMYDSQTRERLVVVDSRGNAFTQNRVPLFEVRW